MQMYRSISILILLQEIVRGTVVEIAVELERSMHAEAFIMTRDRRYSSVLKISHTFYMVHVIF